MDNDLKPETLERIHELCRRISVAHELDATIQEELYGHMEDKLLAYMNGQEPLTEDDAFVLVREHFGDPATVKRLMQDVHASAAQVGLARRLVAVTVATASAYIAKGALLWLVYRAFWLAPEYVGFWAYYTAEVGASLFGLALLWLLLDGWQRRLDTGPSPWFIRIRPAALVGLAALSVAIWAWTPRGIIRVSSTAPSYVNTLLIVPMMFLVLESMIWLWWSERQPRRLATIIFVLAGWFCVHGVVTLNAFATSSMSVDFHILTAVAGTLLVRAILAGGLYVTARYVHDKVRALQISN